VQQHVKNTWQTLAFSKKLNPAQQKYSAYNRELLAIYEAVKHFRHMLEARHFSIFTDHKSITYAFHQKRDKCSPRQFKHLDFIAQFTTDIRHISGQDNVVTYGLCRGEFVTAPQPYDALAASQDTDDEAPITSAVEHRLAARESTTPRHYGAHLLQYLCRENSTVHSSSSTAPSVPVCP
jgi:cleavage and polyadenylation specificity factor subunit 1